MSKGELFRRAFHLCAPVFLVYYAMPGDMWGLGVSREQLLLIVLAGVLMIEAARYAKGITFLGLRDYEAKRISAYAWAGMGLTIAFLCFPMHLVVPVVFGIGWTDPLIGVLRKRSSSLYPGLPFLLYSMICACAFALLNLCEIFYLLPLPLIGSAAALASEYPKSRVVDDDFLMQVVPLGVMYLVEHLYLIYL
ncbi:MAG: hypothetical protein AB1665_01920 [Candidatus Thermoplasmatota archaeon]